MTDHTPVPRIALIGCGRWGRNIARVLARLEALDLIVDPAAASLEAYAAELEARWSRNLHDAFGSEIDAVAIAAPAADHARLARLALEQGKAVFVEKPLALQLSEAEDLAGLADHAKLTLMVGHLLQYHPAFITLCSRVAAGDIGELRHVTSHRLNPGAIRSEENALWSMGPHDFSMVLRLTGREPEHVSALPVRVINPNVPDQYSIQMRFDDTLTALVNVSWLSPYKEHKLTVLGTTGALVFDDTAPERDRKLVLYRNNIDRSAATAVFVKGAGEPVEWPAEEPLEAEMRAFLGSIAGKQQNRTGPQEAIPVLRLLRRAADASF